MRPALLATYACNAYNQCMQYTLRKVPKIVDDALRQRAREQRKSLNEVALQALAHGAGIGDRPMRYRDVSDIAGTWVEDPAFDDAIADQDRVDEAMWK